LPHHVWKFIALATLVLQTKMRIKKNIRIQCKHWILMHLKFSNHKNILNESLLLYCYWCSGEGNPDDGLKNQKIEMLNRPVKSECEMIIRMFALRISELFFSHSLTFFHLSEDVVHLAKKSSWFCLDLFTLFWNEIIKKS